MKLCLVGVLFFLKWKEQMYLVYVAESMRSFAPVKAANNFKRWWTHRNISVKGAYIFIFIIRSTCIPFLSSSVHSESYNKHHKHSKPSSNCRDYRLI